jgi:hypothetical protein
MGCKRKKKGKKRDKRYQEKEKREKIEQVETPPVNLGFGKFSHGFYWLVNMDQEE